MPSKANYTIWAHQVLQAEEAPVFPDGCRDVLIVHRPDESIRVALTDFDVGPRRVRLSGGIGITGYRLRPGVVPGREAMDAIAADPRQATQILAHDFAGADEMAEAVQALAQPGSTLQAVSRGLGVSIRSMQRHFRRAGLPQPDYWRLLGRARSAVDMMSSEASLAAIAHECAFADQAHMTREFVRWFGSTPARLRSEGDHLHLLRQPGLGNWTGEQISTR
ncbi:putative AraC family transcriptional regulator [Sphingobium sp. SYK-6]|uniref:helix-turn-helix domain-containing protein n=1 Tax=Sphingobium sp. (strain NBRC 103272 / SYK-6) TaxID=627192 RepID=UPI0002277099|nr:AraC family transcriptional regulator [Sphingobium sp. SYK-6]BAK66833.1 putative AraC family transcriptional regulator [Sphingobium sp. SYK-6]